MKKIIAIPIFILLISALPSCDDFLDAKPDRALVVPETLFDLQLLLDNSQQVMDRGPALGIMSADELLITTAGWASVSQAEERNSYIWANDIFEGNSSQDWDILFRQVFYSNIVLDQLDKLSPPVKGSQDWNRIKGAAKFKRAYAYYELSQLFTPAYNPASDSPLGLPLRTSPVIDHIPPRSSVWETYNFITSELEEAIPLLPESESIPTRPTKDAARSFLARINLIQGKFQNAANFADQVINNGRILLDYSSLNKSLVFPFPIEGNPEILYYSRMNIFISMILQSNSISPQYLELYHDNDLRKTLFFTIRPVPNTINFTGNYTGTSAYFSGISLNEIYLIAAESNARIGNLQKSVETLDRLLEKRMEEGSFVGTSFYSPEELLEIILDERKKELIMRGLRWGDLKRLNLMGDSNEPLSKTIDGNTYTLPPNDPKYTLPFPDIEILNNGYIQNPR